MTNGPHESLEFEVEEEVVDLGAGQVIPADEIPPEPDMLAERAKAPLVVARARALLITTDQEAVAAQQETKEIRLVREGIKEKWKKRIDAAHKMHKGFIACRDADDELFKQADEIYTAKCNAHARKREDELEQERRRKEEEARKAAAEAREKEQAELRATQEREAAERKAALAAVKAAGDKKAAEELAARNKQAAEDAKADAARLAAAPLAIVEHLEPVEAPAYKAKGVSKKTNWKWRLVNESLVKPIFKCLDDKKITSIVKNNQKDAEEIVGGIYCWDDSGLTFRKD